ncbi:ABC-F family ATP-binding cassette domain-containing protein [Lacticigenium naphthae]|uniref:ABC-F family ATP-binding cassette domain-containing protein n=1 Tax=Lacticigenium naphthae TaxID=515351 RepID=UPI0004181220|nr:ABC-F family ATP-binding cassette domain-containing protein [Lacticigenium naphthae]
MIELKVTDLTLSYGDKELFQSISFSIKEKERIGLIGVNGTGKTSLLNVLTDNLAKDSGTITKPNNYRMGYLKQHPDFDLDQTVLDAVFSGDNPLMNTVKEYEVALENLMLQAEDTKAQDRFSKAEQQMNAQDAWLASTTATTILTKLGITDMNQRANQLSGGQLKRVSLARVLISSPDLLILDEPTNHLDFDMINWLEDYLANYRGSLLLVTHDRYFLDHVVNQIMELSNGSLYQYPGNYHEFIRLKAEREETEALMQHKKTQLFKKELAWMRTGAKARTTKQQARINRFGDLKEEVSQDSGQGDMDLSIKGSRLGTKVLELENASYRIEDNQILDEFNLLIQNNDRIGITGENGSGKTTFLNILAGRVPLDSGILIVGETVKIAYYTQQNEELDPNKRVINYLQEVAEEVVNAEGEKISVTQLLEQFLFNRSSHGTMIGKLSGGEKRRLYLLKLLMQQPNVLLLDEPTNDLDVQTLTVLEDYIEQFTGAVLAVSHDRYFLDKTADKLLVFKGNGKIDTYYGKLTRFLEEEKEKQAEKKSPAKKSTQSKAIEPAPPQQDEKKKLSYMEKKEWETIEMNIAELEKSLEKNKEEMALAGSNYEKIADLESEGKNIEEKLEEKMERWEYLSQFAE